MVFINHRVKTKFPETPGPCRISFRLIPKQHPFPERETGKFTEKHPEQKQPFEDSSRRLVETLDHGVLHGGVDVAGSLALA